MTATWIILLLVTPQETESPNPQEHRPRQIKLVQEQDTPQSLPSKIGKSREIRQELGKANPRDSSRPALQPETIDEIRNIRDRIGIRLFDDPDSDKEFAQQLEKLKRPANSVISPTPIVDAPQAVDSGVRPAIEPARVAPTPFPGAWFPEGSGSPAPVKWAAAPVSPKHRLKSPALPIQALEQATLLSLHQAIGNLDRQALELERSGEFAESGKLRKLSRKIRKQLQEMVVRRDN